MCRGKKRKESRKEKKTVPAITDGDSPKDASAVPEQTIPDIASAAIQETFWVIARVASIRLFASATYFLRAVKSALPIGAPFESALTTAREKASSI